MTILETLLFTLAVEIYAGIISWKFYKKAGFPAWSAFVPIYNTYLLTRIIKRPWWWVILFYIPIVGNIMGVVAVYELFHVFNRHKVKYTIYTLLTAGLYLAYVNYTEELKYVGRSEKTIRKHVSDLTSSLLFAIIAATIIRTFTFEAFTIPTPSMEKSLMVGDFLFVSKMQYGSRMPITPLSIPLMHNRIPGTQKPSFSDAIQLPYVRLPKITEVQRLDPVVFNYPEQDELPIDKRDHYVKRCVAIPGDTLKIINGQVFIDSKAQELPERARPQFSYYVKTNNREGFNKKLLKKNFDINYLSPREQQERQAQGAVQARLNNDKSLSGEYMMTIPTDKLEEFKKLPNVQKVVRLNSQQDPSLYPDDTPLWAKYLNEDYFGRSKDIFPNLAHTKDTLAFKWTRDNYGPIYMPKEGDVIELNYKNYLKFKRVIQVYEGNEFERKGDKYLLNGEEVTSYTFKQGYYWMMGDNRHNSLDSRYWGYVPADHIVGKPVFIWMSYDKFADGFMKSIRSNRVFTMVSGAGERVSYFWLFVGLVIIGYVINHFWKKRKAKAKND